MPAANNKVETETPIMQSASFGHNQTNITALVGRDGSSSFNRQMPGYIEHLAKTRMKDDEKPQKIRPSLLYKLLVICFITLIVSALIFFSAHYFGDKLSRAGHSSSAEKLQIVINNDYLNVPENKIRFGSQRKSGALGKLDLYMHWPSLSGYGDHLSHEFNNSENNANLIFLTIEPQTMTYDMSGRVGLIYQQFFEGKPELTKIGLIRQGLSSDGGFMDEDLFYASASPYPFATRCIKEQTSTAPLCIRDIFIGKNLMATYRFHKKYLPQWIELEQSMRAVVKSMIMSPVEKL